MFQGRYGNDQLNRALSIVAIVLVLIGMFLPRQSGVGLVFSAIPTVLIVWMLVRMFSRDFSARSAENAKFLAWWLPIQSKLRAFFSGNRARTAGRNPTFAERRKYKYFLCTQCAQRLRVPRGKGKLRVTCTRCGNKFEIKS
ncbi:MAG TPA: zinc ribbon domain-containing protein [Feifaniaceae bacterium]|nr:zinc ribbon domain-containing protein [Feifaniaceae bacterium]